MDSEVKLLQSCLFETPWTVTCQAPPSMGFFKQEYYRGCHFLIQMKDMQDVN